MRTGTGTAAVGPTAALGALIAGVRWDDIPGEVREFAKLTILDTLGVALAAREYPIAERIDAYLAAVGAGSGPARVLGSGRRLPTGMAAMANGTFSNALDFDEGPHLATHVWPAVLALGEELGASGAEALEAYIVGREVGARLTVALDSQRFNKRGPTSRGWWHVGVIGPLAAAAGAARLLKLGEDASATALAIATCRAGGQRANMGTMAKALHSGNAAAAGIEAAYLASVGFTADSTVLEAPLGLARALCSADEVDWAPVEAPWSVFELAGGARIKPYPACTPIHAVIDAAVRLVAEGVRAERVQRVVADLHPFSLLRDHPRDAMEAGFSGRFILAATLVHGRFDLGLLTDSAIADPAIQRLMARIVHDSAAAGVEVWTDDGQCHVAHAEPRRRLVGNEPVLAKFHSCSDSVLGEPAARSLADQVLRLEEVKEVRTLTLSSGVQPGVDATGGGPKSTGVAFPHI